MPASASLSIPAIAEHLGGVERSDPGALVPTLSAALTKVVDPRKARGMRHRLVVLLTLTVCAVAAGARSFVAVGEWVADLPGSLADAVGTGDRCPSESTIRRAVQVIDADAFDTVIGGFVQQLSAAVALVGRRRVLAVDGKTVRGSRHTNHAGDIVAGQHLLAVIDQHTRVVLGQVDVETKTNEITAFTPLLDSRRSLRSVQARRLESRPKIRVDAWAAVCPKSSPSPLLISSPAAPDRRPCEVGRIPRYGAALRPGTTLIRLSA